MATLICQIHGCTLVHWPLDKDPWCWPCSQKKPASPVPSPSGPLEVALCKVCGKKMQLLSSARGDGVAKPCAACGRATECRFDEPAALEVVRRALEEARQLAFGEAAKLARSHAGNATLDTTGVERKTLLRFADRLDAIASRALAALGGTAAPAGEDDEASHLGPFGRKLVEAASPAAQRRPAREVAHDSLPTGHCHFGRSGINLHSFTCDVALGSVEADRRGGP